MQVASEGSTVPLTTHRAPHAPRAAPHAGATHRPFAPQPPPSPSSPHAPDFPRPHPQPPEHFPGASCTIRGRPHAPRRSRADLNPAPTASPLMRSLMAHVCLAHGRGSVDVLCLSAHYHPPPDLAVQPTKGSSLTLTPHRYGTQVGSRLCYNLGRWPRRASCASKGAACMHSHRASHRVRPAHQPRARFQ